MHQFYKEKLFGGKIEPLSSEIFSVLDQALCSKKTVNEAKNYKKLLAAIQKSKIMHPTEISVLFVKANRFMNKDAIKKEKQLIKKEIQERVIMEGPVNPEQQEKDESSDPEANEEMPES